MFIQHDLSEMQIKLQQVCGVIDYIHRTSDILEVVSAIKSQAEENVVPNVHARSRRAHSQE